MHCVLCILTGNICRSPIAEAVFKKMATDKGVVDKVTNCDAIKSFICACSTVTKEYKSLFPLYKKGVCMRHPIAGVHRCMET